MGEGLQTPFNTPLIVPNLLSQLNGTLMRIILQIVHGFQSASYTTIVC